MLTKEQLEQLKNWAAVMRAWNDIMQEELEAAKEEEAQDDE